MPLDAAEIDRLRRNAEDWRALWNRLWVELDAHLDGVLLSGPRNDPDAQSLRPRFRLLRDPVTAHDFIAHYLEDLAGKAERGTLLQSFAGTPEQLIPYLAAPSHLRRRAIDFSIRLSACGMSGLPGEAPPRVIGQSSGDDDAPDVLDAAAAPERTGAPIELPLERLFRRISWDQSARIGAVVRHAAMQCWPRLDRDDSGFTRLADDLLAALAPAPDGGSPEAFLEARHRECARTLDESIARVRAQLRDRAGMHQHTREERERHLLALQVDRLLCPLDRVAVQELLGLRSADAAYQQVCRYRRQLETLFPDEHAHVARMTR